MPEYGFLSLLPPILAIVLAIRTKQVFVSLIVGIWLGWLIIDGWNPLLATLDTIQAFVDVFQDKGNARTVMFAALVGALIVFIQRSGGVQGFTQTVMQRLERYEKKQTGRSKVIVQLLAWATGVLVFIESSISVLTVGTLYRPVFDKMGISREKLAYIADSSSAPACILIPINAWGAFIMGLLLAQGIESPFATLMASAMYNFYAILALLLVPILIISKRDFGAMAKAEQRTQAGQILSDNAQTSTSDALTSVEVKEGITPKARNMIVPIAIMVVLMPIMLVYTGWAAALEQVGEEAGIGQLMMAAIGQGSGSTAVLVAVIGSLLLSMLWYGVQGIFTLKESVDLTLQGISALMPIALLMILAFAIGAVCKELQTGIYVAEATKSWLSPSFVPLIVFLVSCFIAFSTGTSWGTFAIMLAIAIPMATTMNSPLTLTIAAALGGGIFGDHCSPISDTTILSAMAASTDHIDHVNTQLPYALTIGGITALLYLILGLTL